MLSEEDIRRIVRLMDEGKHNRATTEGTNGS
jgi:hypothetical protein